MKTIILHETPDFPIQIFIIEGNYSHLNETFLHADDDENRAEELQGLLYDEDGDPLLDTIETRDLAPILSEFQSFSVDFTFIITGELG